MGSPVTYAAIRELRGVNVVTRLKFTSERDLVGRRPPVHGENFFLGPQKTLRLAMTFETPFHVERVFLLREGHLINWTVARGAANAFVHVNAVIEENKIREIIDTIPTQAFVVDQTPAHEREQWRIRPDLRMTTHASLRGGNTSESGSLDGRMTKPAIQSQSADVVLVAEWDRLRPRDVYARGVR
jgi:hypothetical protein